MKQFSERSPLLSPQRKITSEQEEAWLEDAVTVGLRRLCNAWSFMTVMWYISFVVKEGEIVFQSYIHVSNISRVSVVFIPMWLGSIGGIIMIAMGTRHMCGCHKSLRVISKEHQAYLHHTQQDTDGFIAFESLPLLRLYYLWSILSILSVVCLVVTQILWYLWLVKGVIGVWHACIPVGVLCVSGVVYMLLCKSVSAQTGLNILLAFSWLVLVTIKLQEEPSHLSSTTSGLSWVIVAAPLVLLQVGLFLKLCALGWKGLTHAVIVTHKVQWMVWGGYVCALLFSIHSVWVTLHLPSAYDILPPYTGGMSHPLAISWLFIITLLAFGIVVTFHVECRHLARSKGFTSPIPLFQNAIGTFEPQARFLKQNFSIIGTVMSTQHCPHHLSYMGVQRQYIQTASSTNFNERGNRHPTLQHEPDDSNMMQQ